ncbi:uncharacterized protein DEA37_0008844 [Paragonimus westermani]|uniref:Centriolar and ciliogenesis-associated protein HYLS1 C-terminal domain-containing protein n=1 Tax=Paragonimus westermani TaxID=34504 RepID=A0A5J4NWD1_9TREM|nr:uncharacterized protein DEA37_0008844 [Paragonimus westermani]
MPSTTTLSLSLSEAECAFTLEEIRGQLSNLGVSNVSDTQLYQLKQHLDSVIAKERREANWLASNPATAPIDSFATTTVPVSTSVPAVDFVSQVISSTPEPTCSEKSALSMRTLDEFDTRIRSMHLTIPQLDSSDIAARQIGFPSTAQPPVSLTGRRPASSYLARIQQPNVTRSSPNSVSSISDIEDNPSSQAISVGSSDSNQVTPTFSLVSTPPQSLSVQRELPEASEPVHLTPVSQSRTDRSSMVVGTKWLDHNANEQQRLVESSSVYAAHPRQPYTHRLTAVSSSQLTAATTYVTSTFSTSTSKSVTSYTRAPSSPESRIHRFKLTHLTQSSTADSSMTGWSPHSTTCDSSIRSKQLVSLDLNDLLACNAVLQPPNPKPRSLYITNPHHDTVGRSSSLQHHPNSLPFQHQHNQATAHEPLESRVTTALSASPRHIDTTPDMYTRIPLTSDETSFPVSDEDSIRKAKRSRSAGCQSITETPASRSGRSGSRSARFAENPVDKIHTVYSRPIQAVRSSRPTDFVGVNSVDEDCRGRRLSSTLIARRPTLGIPKNRRQDPVSRYHSYQRSWLTHLVPGEDARRILRWNIKTAMMHREVPLLQRNFAEVTQLFGRDAALFLKRERERNLKALQLNYVPPTDRRHDALRWSIRTALGPSGSLGSTSGRVAL